LILILILLRWKFSFACRVCLIKSIIFALSLF